MIYEKLAKLLNHLLERLRSPRIALHAPGGIRYQYYDEILFFESRDHVTYAVLTDGENFRCTESLAAVESELAPDPRFCRCHKGYLVNMDYIERVEDAFVLSNGQQVPYRIREKKKITDNYYRYFLKRNLS